MDKQVLNVSLNKTKYENIYILSIKSMAQNSKSSCIICFWIY